MKNNGNDMEKKSTADYKHSDTQETPDVNKLLDKKEKKRQKKIEKKNANVKTDELGRPYVVKTASSVYSAVMAVIYIVFVLIASGVCSFFAVSIANDVFAFQKKEVTAEISLGNYVTVNELATLLGDEGIIKYPTIFKYYAQLKEETDGFLPGKYEVASNMNYDALLDFFQNQTINREIITLTIPEGYTVDEIIDLFISNGMGSEEGFVDAIQNGDFSDYKFIQLLSEKKLSSERKYRLEGYLFPDTYEFFKDWSETRIIRTLLDGFEARFNEEYYDVIEKSKYTLDDYIIIASMIQAEAKYSTDFELVSSVFHNRLAKPDKYPYLESDATIQYAFPAHKNQITPEDLKIDHPYNTYLRPGLTPGAVCNPGATAILTALQPAETNCYYFVSRANGEMLYATTLAEHNKNIKEIESEN
jgi:UPF0755 protein